MRNFLVNKLLQIDYFFIILFGVNLLAGIFAARDVFVFDRMLRGVAGLVICCLSICSLIGGKRKLASLILFGHYIIVLTSAQIDTDLALVHLSFTGEQLVVSGYHSPYKGIARTDLKTPCPRSVNRNFSAENMIVLQFNDFCQYVIEVGTENYTNHVLIALIAVLPLICIIILAHYIATKFNKPDMSPKKLSEEFRSPTSNDSSQMMSSFTSSELSTYI
ncbi:hypothetical protein M3Y97_00337300 [Aphelenchoides bicaudatus]|nr:hypothetical protein M3Y97_00337300 [Aphelenchoides bicaudatus]